MGPVNTGPAKNPGIRGAGIEMLNDEIGSIGNLVRGEVLIVRLDAIEFFPIGVTAGYMVRTVVSVAHNSVELATSGDILTQDYDRTEAETYFEPYTRERFMVMVRELSHR